MFAFLLVACAGVDDSGTAVLDVDVAPRQFSVTLTNEQMDCRETQEENRTLYEWMGSTYVVNTGDHPISLEASTTHTRGDVTTSDDSEASWLDVSVPSDTYDDIPPGGEEAVGIYAMGRCNGFDRAFDPFATYIYEIEIIVEGEPFTVEGEIVLTPDNSDYE